MDKASCDSDKRKKEMEEKVKQDSEYLLTKTPGKSHLAENITDKAYHLTMDKYHSEVIENYWKVGKKGNEQDTGKQFQNLSECKLTNESIACILQRLCLTCYHQGDSILKISKVLLNKLSNLDIQDKDLFRIITHHLQSYPYIKKRKVAKALESLEQGNEAISNMQPCEWTAWFYRAKASVNLQCAWMFDKARTTFKATSIESFQKSRDHFAIVQQEYPSCQYLKFLSTLSLINLVFLKLQFCWFIFDQHTTMNKFEQYNADTLDLNSAQSLILHAEEESHLLSNGSIYLYDIQYHLLEVKFFLLFRKAQQFKDENIFSEAEKCILLAQHILQDMEKYENENNSHILHAFNTTVYNFIEGLPVKTLESKNVSCGSNDDSSKSKSDYSESNEDIQSKWSTQSSNNETDYNSDLCNL